MPPAPTRIASTPRQNSRTCWNPAVPPPPVPGAAVGNELADGLGDGEGLGDGLGLGVGLRGAAAWGVAVLGVAVGVAALGVAVLGVAVLGVVALDVAVLGVVVLGVLVMGPLPGIVALGVPLAEAAGDAGLVPGGANVGGVVGGEALEQADTDAEASIAMAAQPRTVRRKRRRP
jgi:hypothetical protein